ncbi:MAG TPA: hypothetical protein ENI95_15120 [Chloroflexi bacterium]|nr:hypothetical protein [Chloroflexota bacterium]
MSTWTHRQTYPEPLPRASRSRGQVILARLTLIVTSILILTNLAAALIVAGYQIYYDGLIFPGVSVWGVDLSGMTPAEAAAALQDQFHYPRTVTITFRDGDNIWPVSAESLGVRFDVERTVQAAYEVGRHPRLIPGLRQQLTAWREGVVISPVVVFDQRSADEQLQLIAAQINRPPIDAGIQFEGLEAVATPSQIGRQVDIPATLALLGEKVTTLQSSEINLVVVETPPRIASTEDSVALINSILSSDLEVYIEDAYPEDPGPWVASREALAEMLVVEPVVSADGESMEYTVRLDEQQLEAFLSPLAPALERQPSDARFIFDEETGELQPIVASQQGRRLDIAATIQLINQTVAEGQHRVPLVFEYIEPDIPDTATAEELGITELISSATTYFRGSSSARRHNIQTAASRFHGLVIKPGQEFSFNEYLGDVSLDSGFEEALIIYNGRTIGGVGGGTCQVSTTAFQAAFYAGFPITERWPHGYRVGYYEVGEGPGMDATVYSPIVDLRFVNDTPYHLLIETFVDIDNATVTFRFYSTSDGRTVQKEGPIITNIVPHGPPLYEENPDLAPGQVKQVDYAIDGADVTVYRTVYRDGEVLYQDTFFSQYVPWQAIYQVAPGYVPAGAQRVGG